MRAQLSKMIVFGDSVTWGQGLLDSEKFSTLVNAELAGGNAQCTMVAHSGAVIGMGLDPDVQAAPGEVPRAYPSILQQVRNFSDPSGDFDLVIINGGINDLDVTFILNPLTDVHELSTLTDLYCHDHLAGLLPEVLDRFSKARVIVTGYFPILSERSDPDLLHRFLQSHFISIPSVSEAEIAIGNTLGLDRNAIMDKVVLLAKTFWQESTTAIQKVVAEAKSPRLGAAFAPFTPANSALADDPWLWGVTALLEPQDPMADTRRPLCDAAETDILKRFICHRASAGHPNLEGARQFAQAILKTLTQLSPP
jgi:lysophospholipase L1-like esterase